MGVFLFILLLFVFSDLAIEALIIAFIQNKLIDLSLFHKKNHSGKTEKH